MGEFKSYDRRHRKRTRLSWSQTKRHTKTMSGWASYHSWHAAFHGAWKLEISKGKIKGKGMWMFRYRVEFHHVVVFVSVWFSLESNRIYISHILFVLGTIVFDESMIYHGDIVLWCSMFKSPKIDPSISMFIAIWSMCKAVAKGALAVIFPTFLQRQAAKRERSKLIVFWNILQVLHVNHGEPARHRIV